LKKLYFVYFIISKKNSLLKTYVGYTNNLKERIKKHNSGKGAKSTRGRKWKLVFKKKFSSKSSAMKYEYYLKKNTKLRNLLKNKHV
tara:strand:- start:241 stop:498 length:258 start_codon:yes stop_codon:yes gene_type:complete